MRFLLESTAAQWVWVFQQALRRRALCLIVAVQLEHLPLADAIASATARRLFPLVEREDLIQVAREAIDDSGTPPAPI